MKGKRTSGWSIRRQLIWRSDGQTRWDQAYQHLLQRTLNREGASTPGAPLAPMLQEVTDARCSLRPCLDQPASPSADH